MTEEIEQAKELFKQMANRALRKKVDELVAAGSAEWHLDPWIKNVVGLVKPGTNTAFLVVYVADEDFEVNDELMYA